MTNRYRNYMTFLKKFRRLWVFLIVLAGLIFVLLIDPGPKSSRVPNGSSTPARTSATNSRLALNLHTPTATRIDGLTGPTTIKVSPPNPKMIFPTDSTQPATSMTMPLTRSTLTSAEALTTSPLPTASLKPTASHMPPVPLSTSPVIVLPTSEATTIPPRSADTPTPTGIPAATVTPTTTAGLSQISIISPIATPLPVPSPTQEATPITPGPTLPAKPAYTPTLTATQTATAILLQLDIMSPLATPTPAPSPTPSPTATWQPTPISQDVVARVPILMYHYLSVPPAGADIYRQDLSVTPENFATQLAYLKEEGYTTISLADLTYHLAGFTPLPDKPIILTFDDGYADNYTNAFPLLKEYGFKATFSLVTQPIDFGDPNYISWDNVIEMHAAGMEFGAHTYRHLDLRGRDIDFLVYEIVGAKEAIEARIQEPVRYFVYPAGHYDQLVIDVVASANFWGALTTQYGFEHRHETRFEIQRIRIRGSDTLPVFINRIEAGQ